ncbi:type II toxin-antitoxin system VapC family toxin [Hoeflea ulvae]|uniref:Type II toxin-antitoxin system VapC family toxin n=1 Tax=Hoeflea ulvae TaxID=2983764 RepID=A0ABT3YKI4_9HYPH|nr:type II toxin-antitoxin system VapC family toxin [Hoeflea ulvae]MCY0096255.1 type II toxin-antitoxin system VapC family toxin [Hoeflea ulvae]
MVDASVIFAWQFPDEVSDTVEQVAEMLIDQTAWVPAHWHAEIANGFAVAVRRKRLTPEYRHGALMRISDLPIKTDQESAAALWNEAQVICDDYQLSAYDAAYLELARRRRIPLATLDNAMIRAADALDISLIGKRSS